MFTALENLALDSALNQWIAQTFWLWPVLEISHFVGLSMLLGGLLVIDLRLAGHYRQFSLQATHQLIPLVLVGFFINLVTGILFFYGDPERYATNVGFQLKMLLIVLAGANAGLYYWKLHALVSGWTTDTAATPLARAVAYASLLLWFGVLLCGRLIPYVGTGLTGE